MTQPVTWDQIIDAASDNGRFVGVQANKYEGYVVWINALIEGAGGDIVSDTEAGADATIDIGSEAGTEAAQGHPQAGGVARLDAGPVGVERGYGARAHSRRTVVPSRSTGRSSTTTTPAIRRRWGDLGWARYPETVEGEESRPPIGGINVGVGVVHR